MVVCNTCLILEDRDNGPVAFSGSPWTSRSAWGCPRPFSYFQVFGVVNGHGERSGDNGSERSLRRSLRTSLTDEVRPAQEERGGGKKDVLTPDPGKKGETCSVKVAINRSRRNQTLTPRSPFRARRRKKGGFFPGQSTPPSDRSGRQITFRTIGGGRGGGERGVFFPRRK